MNKRTVLITGAAGNLGGLLADYLKSEVNLHLLIHKKDVPDKLKNHPNVKVFRADLAKKESLDAALKGVDAIVHFAGVLFKANPEKFLPETNTYYFKNLLEKANEYNIKRVILISFPHVEGETTPEHPASGKLDGNPISMHAKTRLEEEKMLFDSKRYKGEAVSLRVGMVYGKGILMIEAACTFAKYHLLGVWKNPTWIHLISTEDFLKATSAAALKDDILGIYHLGDDGIQTLQEFLDDLCISRNYGKPWRMPIWMINTAAWFFEFASKLFGIMSPLTRDFIKIGQVSYYGDTTRMKKDLLPELTYKTYKENTI